MSKRKPIGWADAVRYPLSPGVNMIAPEGGRVDLAMKREKRRKAESKPKAPSSGVSS